MYLREERDLRFCKTKLDFVDLLVLLNYIPEPLHLD